MEERRTSFHEKAWTRHREFLRVSWKNLRSIRHKRRLAAGFELLIRPEKDGRIAGRTSERGERLARAGLHRAGVVRGLWTGKAVWTGTSAGPLCVAGRTAWLSRFFCFSASRRNFILSRAPERTGRQASPPLCSLWREQCRTFFHDYRISVLLKNY